MTQPLFEHLSELGPIVSSARRVLVLSDFDGTLTPLVSQPEQANLAPEVRLLLKSLADSPRHAVAIVSGRSLEDLKCRIAIPGITLSANHGLEIQARGLHFIEPNAQRLAPAIGLIVDRLRIDLDRVPGIFVEDKHFTASVHVRNVPPGLHQEVRSVILRQVQPFEDQIRTRDGHSVFEIRPRVDWTKGSAALWIRDRIAADADAIVVLGDDNTDEDAFEMLPEDITIKVGSAPTAARFRIDSPTEAVAVLRWLLDETTVGCAVIPRPRLWPF